MLSRINIVLNRYNLALTRCLMSFSKYNISSNMSCQVKVSEGTLQGKECKTFYGKKYYSFEGIPYAKPPVEKFRFRDPQPPSPWTGILDATKPGAKCIQSNPYSSTPIDGSEDCLFLNIYTPVLPYEKNTKLPVFFFVHGGRLIFGYGNYYTPDYLLKHDVILVTVNYRLHILGWLCLNIPECPGNAGLKDTVMALKWVNKNIDAFNGDCRNIIVYGESAGAAIVTSYLTSNMTVGLYSKVIAQSGNCIADLYIVEEDPIAKARNIASIMGSELTDENEIFEYFTKAPIEELVIAFTTAELSRPRSVIHAYFLPVIEKKFEGVDSFFTEHPKISIQNNRFQKVPIISCLNSLEGAIFFRDKDKVLYEEDFYYFVPRFTFLDINSRKAILLQDSIRQFYLKDKNLDDGVKTEYLTMVSDVFFIRDIMIFYEMLSRYTDQIYAMKFSYTGSMHTRVMSSIGAKGATHGDMIQYQFYRESKASKATEKDLEIVEFLSEAFCNFARNGVPTWSNQKTKWLPYTKHDRRTLLVDEDITCPKDVDRERLEFWIQLLKEHCKL